MAADTGIRKIWGLAKSKELHLSDDDLHELVMACTGKDSIRALNQNERAAVIGRLAELKDKAERGTAKEKRIRGNLGTQNQRKKIYVLSRSLGWNGRHRINGLCRKMFNIECVEWLDYKQCSALIEALKSMAERKEGTGD